MSLKSIFCRHAVRLKAADLDKNALTWQCSKCSKTFIRNPNKKLKWPRVDLDNATAEAWAKLSKPQRKYMQRMRRVKD